MAERIVKGEKTLVLVGTYRSACRGWLLTKHGKERRSYYNFPFHGTDKEAQTFKGIGCLFLFSTEYAPILRTAKYVGIITGEELKTRLGYPSRENPHSDRYVLLETLGEIDLKTARAIRSDAESRFVIGVDKVARSRHKWIDILSRYVSSTKVAFDDWAQTNKIPKWICDATAYMPKSKGRMFAQMDFFRMIDEVDKKTAQFKNRKKNDKTTRFIDLFAGIGGIRKGFEQACADRGINTECVFTSEIKPHAIDVLKQNHPDEYIFGDITKVNAKDIPDFDVLLGGFPCQAFSAAGKRLGFEDTRGTLFFDVARILKEKKPKGFVLENVEGLVNHDKKNPKAPYGHTLEVILATLDELGYKVSWRVLNASEFGVPQDRKRIYIVGARNVKPNLAAFQKTHTTIDSVLEHGLSHAKSRFIDKLLSHYTVEELEGKAIKDKRGGNNNIHSWDFEYKGKVSQKQRKLLNALLRERRKHQWADQYGIDWMDGMPLTIDMIRTFFDDDHLEEMLEDLAEKRYVVKEHPKRKVRDGKTFIRVQDPTLPLGYNIVAGKMSFEISKVMSPDEIAPTLVAMDMQHLYVADGDGLRTLTLREGLGLFGYPKDFKFDVAKDLGYDLLGNTVVVPVIKAVAGRLLNIVK